MENARTVTPKDFFLWLGIVLSLYGSATALITLLFEYINRTFPDPLAGSADPFSSTTHVAMATLLVLLPLFFALMYLVRKDAEAMPAKEQIWVRRWAIMLTLFIAAGIVAIDLITLFTTFFGGELTIRFLLKVLTVLLVGLGIFLHFLAARWGYWIRNPRKSRIVAIATLVLGALVILGGFYVIGTPTDIRLQRLDAQKAMDLQSIQWRLVEYYQQKQQLPEELSVLADPISGFTLPTDPATGAQYGYSVTDDRSFSLCATFNRDSVSLEGKGAYPSRDMAYHSRGISDNWSHGTGEVCFERTIDPELYPPYPKPL